MTQYSEVGQSSRQASHFLGEHFPLAPDAIRVAYQQYWHDTQPSYQAANEQQLNMRTTNTLMRDFYTGRLTPQAYGGAMLTPLVQATEDRELRSRALDALHTYVSTTNESHDDIIFGLGLATDQSVIRTFQNDIVTKLYPASDEPWAASPVDATAHDILRIRTELGVNIESHLIAATNSLRWFLSYNPMGYADALQRARRAESLHAPICEIIGFDGIAMALQSNLATMQLRQLGQEQYSEQARQHLLHLADPHITDQRVHDMLTAAQGSSQHQQVLQHGEKHGIMIGEGTTGPDDLRVVWRKKTLGSTARRFARLPAGMFPPDIIGATVITNDAHQSGTVLMTALRNIEADSRMKLQLSPSRDKPLHVRGAPEYIADVAAGMGYESIEALEQDADVRRTSASDYQVAKVTFSFQQWGEPQPLDVELQTNRVTDRYEARVGSAAHALYKLTGKSATPEETDAIAKIHSRKKFLGENGLTRQSEERAAVLMHDIYAQAESH